MTNDEAIKLIEEACNQAVITAVHPEITETR